MLLLLPNLVYNCTAVSEAVCFWLLHVIHALQRIFTCLELWPAACGGAGWHSKPRRDSASMACPIKDHGHGFCEKTNRMVCWGVPIIIIDTVLRITNVTAARVHHDFLYSAIRQMSQGQTHSCRSLDVEIYRRWKFAWSHENDIVTTKSDTWMLGCFVCVPGFRELIRAEKMIPKQYQNNITAKPKAICKS